MAERIIDIYLDIVALMEGGGYTPVSGSYPPSDSVLDSFPNLKENPKLPYSLNISEN